MSGHEIGAEPNGGSLLVDKDGDVWRHNDVTWICLSEAGEGTWAEIQWCAPFQVFTPQTDDGAAVAAQSMGGSLPPDASSSPAGPGPDKTGGQPGPASFQMIRHRDVTGVSGTGLIGEGTQFRDGTTVFRWYGEHPSTSVWPSVDELVAVHGHQGATELRWLDGGA